MTAIAFLGMGVMGSAMAANLAKAQTNTPVKIWNRTGSRPEIQRAIAAGATQYDTIGETVADASIIFTCLGDVPDVKAVLLEEGGVIDHAQPGALVVET
ncbi:MAG: NAD(P)-binding domain-containing protein, partial [Cyanophyceae cyanobacterium]